MASICTTDGLLLSPPGMRKPLASQGCTGLGLARHQSHAFCSSSSREAARSLTMPRPLALAGLSSVPWVMSSKLFWMPIRRGRRCVPPAPGSRPSLTSGRPILALGSSMAKRAWQASASSRPPPSVVPLRAATTGLPHFSMRRSRALSSSPNWKACSTVVIWLSWSISAPTMKVGLPEVMTRPLRASSFSSRSRRVAKPPSSSGVSTFMARPGWSKLTRPMPLASTSNVTVLFWVMGGPFLKRVR